MPRIPFSCTDRDVNTNSVSCAIANEFLENETVIINIDIYDKNILMCFIEYNYISIPN